jgi:putative sterol carrier protein
MQDAPRYGSAFIAVFICGHDLRRRPRRQKAQRFLVPAAFPRYAECRIHAREHTMTLEETAEVLRQHASGKPAIGARVKIDLGAAGQLVVDGTGANNVILTEDGPAGCTLIMSAADFGALLDGSLSPMPAYMSGRMKITGDMGLAMRLAQLI